MYIARWLYWFVCQKDTLLHSLIELPRFAPFTYRLILNLILRTSFQKSYCSCKRILLDQRRQPQGLISKSIYMRFLSSMLSNALSSALVPHSDLSLIQANNSKAYDAMQKLVKKKMLPGSCVAFGEKSGRTGHQRLIIGRVMGTFGDYYFEGDAVQMIKDTPTWYDYKNLCRGINFPHTVDAWELGEETHRYPGQTRSSLSREDIETIEVLIN